MIAEILKLLPARLKVRGVEYLEDYPNQVQDPLTIMTWDSPEK
jgi:hypothetical protein